MATAAVVLEVRRACVTLREGKAISIFMTDADLLERQIDKLRESEERYHALFNAIDAGFCIIEVLFDETEKPIDYRFDEINPAFVQQTGLSNVQGRRVREFVPEHEEHWFQIYGGVAVTGKPARFINRAEGLNRWFDVYAFRMGEPAGRKVAVLFTDITEKHQAEAALRTREEQLRQSEERLRIALRTAELGTWAYNPRTGELDADDRMREIFGLPAGTALSYEAFISAIHPLDRERVHALLQRVLRRENIERYHEEYRILAKGAGVERWIRDAGRLSFEEGRGPVQLVGTVLDISDLVQARELLARRGEELERTVKERTTQLREIVQQLETFSYSVVHDMRAPLRSVRSFANILDEEYSAQLDDKARGYLHRIQGSVERMDSLITDVLTYSRVTSTEAVLTRVDVDRLTHEIVEQYPQFQEFTGSVTIHSPLPSVLGNRALLTQCFSNLLGNAIKFIPSGRKPEVLIRAEAKGSTVRLWVEDNGIGIRSEYHERIFGLFQRLHRADQYPGTGVGLAIVQKAAERMRGSVGFESEFGRGSRFWIELLAPDEQA